MIKKFYVDINELYNYASFLNKNVAVINSNINLISKANNQYQTLMKDNISVQVDLHLKKIKKVFDNFSLELNKLSKELKEDHALYTAYNSKLK